MCLQKLRKYKLKSISTDWVINVKYCIHLSIKCPWTCDPYFVFWMVLQTLCYWQTWQGTGLCVLTLSFSGGYWLDSSTIVLIVSTLSFFGACFYFLNEWVFMITVCRYERYILTEKVTRGLWYVFVKYNATNPQCSQFIPTHSNQPIHFATYPYCKQFRLQLTHTTAKTYCNTFTQQQIHPHCNQSILHQIHIAPNPHYNPSFHNLKQIHTKSKPHYIQITLQPN